MESIVGAKEDLPPVPVTFAAGSGMKRQRIDAGQHSLSALFSPPCIGGLGGRHPRATVVQQQLLLCGGNAI